MRHVTAALLLLLLFNACKSNNKKVLPIYGNRQSTTIMVNGQQVTDTIYQTIPAFKFVNQYGDSVGSKNLQGDIYVADFFFTTCPSICPIMQRNMLKVYNAYKDTAGVKIVSFTIDPKHDTVPVLKKYADNLGISGNSWWLINGDRDSVYQLAGSYLVGVKADSATPGGYIHDGYFMLIDKQKHIRGTYDGTDPKQVDQLIADIKTLKTEPAVKMKLKIIGGICLLLMVLVYACESEDTLEFKRYYTNGAVIYHDHCQNCHGSKGEGLAALIPPMNDSSFLKSNKAQLPCIIQNGANAPVKVSGKVFNGAMPAAGLTPIEIAQVITYVSNSFGNKLGVTTVDDVGVDLAKCGK